MWLALLGAGYCIAAALPLSNLTLKSLDPGDGLNSLLRMQTSCINNNQIVKKHV